MYRSEERVQRDAGFTLVEILVSTVIVSIVIVAAISIYLTAYRGYDRSMAVTLIQDEGSRIIDVVRRTIHASTRAEIINGELVLEVHADSLEYNENGKCNQVVFRHQAPTEGESGLIVQEFNNCVDVVGGTYENVISNQGAATSVNVLEFVPNVTSDIAQRTYLVEIDFILSRGSERNDRGNYTVEVPFETKISTRGYVR